MTEHTAVDRGNCPACGAQAEWNPGRQVLACRFCGTEAPYEVDGDSGELREIDLVRTLRELPDELRGWQTDRRSVKCRRCHAISVFDPELVGRNCEFCGSPELVDYEEIQAPIRPQSLLPFRVDRVQVRETIRDWYSRRWFAPNNLKQKANVDTVRGVYLPYWTFDARVHCPWEAESGTYYYRTQTDRDSKGRSRTRRVRHVRWRPASGEVDHFFDDEPVPGTRGADRRLLSGIEPFPTAELVPYDTSYLAGFVVEHYQVVLIDAARNARKSMDEQLRHKCSSQVPGDTQRNLRISPSYSGQTFKHILVPAWMLAYTYGSRTFQVLVNGYTGEIAGQFPKSVWKILILVVGLLAAAGGLALAIRFF